MSKKEQTNGGSKIEFRIVEVNKNEKGELEAKQAKKLSIASIAKIKELEESGYLEINVGYHEAFKEGEKIVKRVVDGKEIKSNDQKQKTKKSSKKSNETLESR